MHAFQRDHNADWNDVTDRQGNRIDFKTLEPEADGLIRKAGLK